MEIVGTSGTSGRGPVASEGGCSSGLGLSGVTGFETPAGPVPALVVAVTENV